MLSVRCPVCPVLSSCLSITFKHCGQTIGRIKTKLNWHAGRPQPSWPHCVRWRLSPFHPQKGGGAPSPIFGLFLLWPNGLMHQDASCTEVGLSPGDFVLDGDPAPPSPKRGRRPFPPIFGPCPLWPNGWMHQAATWSGGRPEPGRLCDRWEPSPPPQKGADHPIFSPRILWSNGCMDQDAAWYGGRRRPARHCVRWGPSFPPLKWHSPQFLAIVCCGQTAGLIKMPFGMEVGLGPGDFVFDGNAAIPRKKGTPTSLDFRPMPIVAKRLDG